MQAATTTDVVPEAPPPAPRDRRRPLIATAVFGVGVALLTAVQLFLVQAGTAPWRTIFVEDGPVYFSDARDHGLGALFRPYAGYGQLLPRLLAVASPMVSIEALPVYLAVAGAVTTALCGAAVYWLARPLVPSRALRLVVAVAPAVLPVAVWQNLDNITYTIWPILYAGFWALIVDPGTERRRVVVAAVVAGIAAASNGLALLFAPLAVYGALTRRTRAAGAIVLGGFSAGLLYQAVVLVGASGTDRAPAEQLGTLYLVRVVGEAVLGTTWTASVWSSRGILPFVVAAVALGVVVMVLAVVADRDHRRGGLIAVAYSPVLFVAALLVRGTAAVDGTGMRLESGSYLASGARYATAGVLMLLTGVVILASSPSPHRWARTAVTVVLAAQLVVVVAVAAPVTNWRSTTPPWSSVLRDARARCAAPGAPATVDLPITPTSWDIEVLCADL